jgi:hypothetical protein
VHGDLARLEDEYEVLRRDYLRLQWNYEKIKRELEHARAAIAFDQAAKDAEALMAPEGLPF